MKQYVAEAFNDVADEYDQKIAEMIKADIEDQILGWSLEDEHETRSALNNFESNGYTFSDTWEWDLQDYTGRYLWNLYAIVYGISQYNYEG